MSFKPFIVIGAVWLWVHLLELAEEQKRFAETQEQQGFTSTAIACRNAMRMYWVMAWIEAIIAAALLML